MRQTCLQHADFLACNQIQVPGGYTVYANAMSKLGLPQTLLLRGVCQWCTTRLELLFISGNILPITKQIIYRIINC
jgi:hypothetical protein